MARDLSKMTNIEDLRRVARRKVPKMFFDYVRSGSWTESTLHHNTRDFDPIKFQQRVLVDMTNRTLETTMIGETVKMPVAIAPTGFTGMMYADGEILAAKAAEKFGVPFSLSTMSICSIEDVAENTSKPFWFQLYVMREREISYGLVERAAKAGFDTLFFTVDTPVAGARLRDKRNGFSIPPHLTMKTLLNAIPRPWWWFDFLTTPKLEFASLSSTGGTVGELLDNAMDPSINYEDLKIIREMWPGKIVIKGVQNLEDSKKLADLGVDGILLSNHGGRQLDRAPVPFHLLPEVVREVGNDVEVMVDTGIMNGADIVASMALGAKFTLVGRAYLYGLMAGGRRGVDRTIEILSDEVRRTMKLLQVHNIAELEPKHVTQLRRLQPIPKA